MLSTITPYRCAKCGSGKIVPCHNGKKLSLFSATFRKQPKISEFQCMECHSALPYCMNVHDKAAVDSIIAIGGESEKTVASYLRKYKNLEINPFLHMINLGR